MSKSFNVYNRYKIREVDGVCEYPQGYKNIPPGELREHDKSGTTLNQDIDWPRALSRHPNKKNHGTGRKWICKKFKSTKYINRKFEENE